MVRRPNGATSAEIVKTRIITKIKGLGNAQALADYGQVTAT